MVFNLEKYVKSLEVGIDTHILNPKSSLILDPPHQPSLASYTVMS